MSKRARARVRLVGLALTLAITSLATSGCRSVWVHPDASHEKYSADLYRCRYGVDPPTADEIRSGTVASPRARRDWKLCMNTLGWSPRVGMSWDPPYGRK